MSKVKRDVGRGFIEVGSAVQDRDLCFIGMPDGWYEPCRKPLSGTTLHIITFRKAKIPWLINALMAEAGIESVEYDPEFVS